MVSGKRVSGRKLESDPTVTEGEPPQENVQQPWWGNAWSKLKLKLKLKLEFVSVIRGRLLKVLIPAIVFATTLNACVPVPVIIQVQQVSCSRASGQSLGFLPKGDADAIGYLSTKVSYPGSKADLSSVEQHYLTANTWSNVAHELNAIARKQDIYSDAQAGRWTYPGWRVDVFKGIVDRYVSSDDTPLPERVRELLDHKQQAFQTSPPSMQASAWTSLTSHIGRYGSFDVACFVMIGLQLSFCSYMLLELAIWRGIL
tara:strand:- start:99 stop:869 length:771 start_codon:yes stop_codon:yes gene_type:complete